LRAYRAPAEACFTIGVITFPIFGRLQVALLNEFVLQSLQQLQPSIYMATTSIVISMRLPAESGERLKRMATRNGWTPSDASARLVEEGLRRSEFAFIDFRDSPAGRQAYIQGSSLAVWEVLLINRDHKGDLSAVAKHLRWPETKVQAALNYAKAFPAETEEALAENDAIDIDTLSRMLPQTKEFRMGERSGKH
jgi:hypothetical protein